MYGCLLIERHCFLAHWILSYRRKAPGCGSCSRDTHKTSLWLIPLRAQVTSLTPQGPIGKFVCTMRTFSTLCLLHQLLLKEMYTGMFADKDPPRKQHEPMTTDDPMDFVDFDEVRAWCVGVSALFLVGGDSWGAKAEA